MADIFAPALLLALRKVKAKRPRTVIDHILKHGFITTEDLESKYGYNHPPRAARDVREAGIPLETFKVKGSHGRVIAAYRFGDPKKIESHKLAGRKVFSKVLAESLYKGLHGRCAGCFSSYERRFLQIDHRVPYEVAGDRVSDEITPEAFMLLCGSCQRAKSWSCEQCTNWREVKNLDTCKSCYWGDPNNYSHIAMNPMRRLELVWQGKEVRYFDKLATLAKKSSLHISELAHRVIKESLRGQGGNSN